MATNNLFSLPSLPSIGYTNALDSTNMGGFNSEALGSIANYGTAADTSGISTAVNQAAGPATSQGLWDWFSNSAFGGTNMKTGQQSGGWAMPAVSLLGGLASFVQGNAAQDIAKGQLKESQRQFDLNYNTQRQTLNTAMEDRQRARVAAGGEGAYESVDSYLARNKV